ncbi:hypothetical protein SFRURICE_008800 [Spodoptera frugiperda]|nr:hypothetical protein SFRURICE_008800 [Spodoptera frugiperda]
MSLQSHVKLQDDIYVRLSRAKINFKKSPRDRITVQYLETRLEMIEDLWAQFTVTHTQIIRDIEYEQLTSSPYIVNEVYFNTEELYLDLKCYKQAMALEFLGTKSSKNSVCKEKVFHTAVNTTKVCPVCNSSEHKIRNCKQFVNKDVDIRRKFVQDHNLCFNCLGYNHSARLCKCTASCRICKRRHHSLLHPKSEQESAGVKGNLSTRAHSTIVGNISNITVMHTHLSENEILKKKLRKEPVREKLKTKRKEELTLP